MEGPFSISAARIGSDVQRLPAAASAAMPRVLFGLRLWASVSLALLVAYWLQLDDAYWAGTSASVVAQPGLGASLRKDDTAQLARMPWALPLPSASRRSWVSSSCHRSTVVFLASR
jgi:hypothetical protein